MQTALPRASIAQRLALLCLGLLLAVTCLSAAIRHGAAGLGCSPWPACFGQGEPAAAPGAVVVAGQALTVARTAHRITATLALLVVIALVVLHWRAGPAQRREAILASALLLLALALAVLGVVTPHSRMPAVAVGNLLGGLLMVGLAACLPMPRRRAGLNLGAVLVALLLLAQIAGGAMVSASHAGLACTDAAECVAMAQAGGWNWQELRPWREAGFAVGTPHAEGALVQLLHRLGSGLAGLGVALLGLAALRTADAAARREGGALLLLLAAEMALGMALGSTGLPLLPVLLHNLASALMLALVLRRV